MDFCYIARKSSLDEADLNALQDALWRFKDKRKVFETLQIHPNGISIPRIHALQHYHEVIQLFGAPNGLCSSITESKHIEAVKKPWRRSNKHNALDQMLTTNQRSSKLTYFRARCTAQGMLSLIYLDFANEYYL